jgi:UDP-N-acetyl-D-galactosamine dehydrogenase
MMIAASRQVRGAQVAALDLTFKENVPDLRNTKVVDIVNDLRGHGVDFRVHNPPD